MRVFTNITRLALIAVFALIACGVATAANPAVAQAGQTWQLLDYIAVDYAEAVRDGLVVNEAEYSEMLEFAASVRSQLQELPVVPSQAELVADAEQLDAAIKDRAEPAVVRQRATALADKVLVAYRLGASPDAVPDVASASALYARQCAACHGATGAGDGPAAASLDPPPIDFTDAHRASQRSPFSLYQVITQGLPGTSMASYSHLSDADRWALAYHVGSMAYSREDAAAGAALWNGTPQHRPVQTLQELSNSSPADLARTVGDVQARQIIAYLRSNPSAVAQRTSVEGLGLARSLLDDSLSAYRKGDAVLSRRLALSAYLDGVEPIEPMLASRDRPLLQEVESAMALFREQIAKSAPVDQLAGQHDRIAGLFDQADAALRGSQNDSTAAFLGSFTILLREGLEALLIIIGMIAFLRKAERRDALPYVHAGWVGALLAGAFTWVVATYLIGISGANREITEGLSALFAAVVLLSVGVWMHQKSLAGRWQDYLRSRMSAAMTRRSGLFLFLLAFVAVYREVFETILFFAAMWSGQNSGAILGGLAAGTVALAIVAFWMLRISRSLPIARFFRVSSIFIAVLAVVLVGKGVAALQEAGWIAQSFLDAPRIEWIGLYPTWQSLLAQIAVAAVAWIAFSANARSSRDPEQVAG